MLYRLAWRWGHRLDWRWGLLFRIILFLFAIKEVFSNHPVPLSKEGSTSFPKPFSPQGTRDVTALRCSEPLRYKVGGPIKGLARLCGLGPPGVEWGQACWNRLGWSGDRLAGTALLKVGLLYRLKLGAALYAEGTEGGGEDGDEEIDDGFPILFFHVHSFCLMFDNILITLKMGRMSKYPFMTGILFCLLMVALGVIGILRTAPCLVF